MKIVSFPPFDLDRSLHHLSHHLSSNTSTPNETKRIRNEKGGTASGKTTVVEEICQRLHDQCVVMLSQDSFYRGLTEAELENVGAYNFDVPSAFDVAAMVDCLRDLRNMKAVDVPVYDFTRHARDETRARRVEPADVVVVEGILVLQMPEVREFLNMRVFVDTDDDVRLARRIQRDVAW